jgi:hypothetical protein
VRNGGREGREGRRGRQGRTSIRITSYWSFSTCSTHSRPSLTARTENCEKRKSQYSVERGKRKDRGRTFIFLSVFVTISLIKALSSANRILTSSGFLVRSTSMTAEKRDRFVGMGEGTEAGSGCERGLSEGALVRGIVTVMREPRPGPGEERVTEPSINSTSCRRK